MRFGSRVGTQGVAGQDEDGGEVIAPCVIPERFWL